jgi:hypothetical protein
VRVTTGHATVDAALQVAGQSEQILVTADRPSEAAQIVASARRTTSFRSYRRK